MKVGVVVPTFRRLERLKLCLRGLDAQITPPSEIVVVYVSWM